MQCGTLTGKVPFRFISVPVVPLVPVTFANNISFSNAIVSARRTEPAKAEEAKQWWQTAGKLRTLVSGDLHRELKTAKENVKKIACVPGAGARKRS